jgi:ABC-type nitrate/sulfonate/bicarbonate transport system permease component
MHGTGSGRSGSAARVLEAQRLGAGAVADRPMTSEVPARTAPMERSMPHNQRDELAAIGERMSRMAEFLRSPRPYLMLVGFGILFGFWHLSVDVWKLPRFREMPGLLDVLHEWTGRDPAFGVSVFTADYYHDIWVSCRRVGIAFAIATCLGVPLGLILGWSRKFCAYVFPVFEIFRPIPVIAWVPLAILMFTGSETPVIFLVTMAAFFAVTINAMLGVQSIDESFMRAAACLGANKWQIFRHVVIPGALPFVFTGLQIGMGVAWFSLVVGEMVAGQYGLGYRINSSYALVAYPTIVIAMATLGFVGYLSSAMVRIVANTLMRWRARELSL